MLVKSCAVVALAMALLSSAGCASSQDGDVRNVATRFYAAVSSGNGKAACAVLSVRTASEVEKSARKPCAEAILDEKIPDVHGAQDVKTFGTMSMVSYAGESAFLSRFGGGWRVVAVGCKPPAAGAGQPYDCEVQGG